MGLEIIQNFTGTLIFARKTMVLSMIYNCQAPDQISVFNISHFDKDGQRQELSHFHSPKPHQLRLYCFCFSEFQAVSRKLSTKQIEVRKW